MLKYKKRTIGGVIGGFLLAGGAAFAAITLFGAGHVAAAATVPTPLTVDSAEFVTTLLPGGAADVRGIVHNPNTFPVKVTSVIIKDAGAVGTGTGCQNTTLHIGGTSGTYAVSSTGPSVAGHQFILASTVSIAAGGAEWVTVPAAVSQDATATAFCGFDADVAVTATAGS
jgi:hypothetical protein